MHGDIPQGYYPYKNWWRNGWEIKDDFQEEK